MESFGIDLKFLLAQILNFGILVFVLNKLLYKPLLKMLEDRRKKIAEGLSDADKVKAALANIEKEREDLLKSTRREGFKILEDSRTMAEKEREQILSQAQDEARVALERTRKKLAEEENQVVEKAKERIAQLAVAMTEKLLKDTADQTAQHNLIAKDIERLEKYEQKK
ncbi:MAG: F0F1 ATP synthase subunit B [Patescibacteria group bacterium]